MSASREKKTRQELASQGIKDPKAIREAEEKAKQRKANRLYGGIAVLFVVVAVVLLLVNAGVFYRDPDAVTIGGENYSAAQVNYYYQGLYNSIANAGYYGLDTSKPLDQQNLNDTAKLLLQVTDEGDITWDQFLRDEAIRQLSTNAMAVREAEANGHGADDDIKAEVQDTLASIKTAVKSNGHSFKSYLKAVYGQGMTPSVFEGMLTMEEVSSHYKQEYQDELTYTADQLEQRYQEDPSDFDMANYEYIYFKGSAASTTDADGNTVQPTEEESAAAKTAAAEAAAAALERYQNGETLLAISKDYEDLGTYSSVDAGSNNGSAMSAWVFDAARTAGEGAVVTDDPNSYVVVFHSCGRQEYNSVDVRHILFLVDSSSLDKDSETYDADLQALKDGAKAKAEDALAQWQATAGTEDAFAALANELSEDGGSNTNGGLYTKILKGQMVTEFNDWCFDESRQPGDTGIVETSYGVHVMYFHGFGNSYRDTLVENALRTADYNAWHDGVVGDNAYTTVPFGMKFTTK